MRVPFRNVLTENFFYPCLFGCAHAHSRWWLYRLHFVVWFFIVGILIFVCCVSVRDQGQSTIYRKRISVRAMEWLHFMCIWKQSNWSIGSLNWCYVCTRTRIVTAAKLSSQTPKKTMCECHTIFILFSPRFACVFNFVCSFGFYIFFFYYPTHWCSSRFFSRLFYGLLRLIYLIFRAFKLILKKNSWVCLLFLCSEISSILVCDAKCE